MPRKAPKQKLSGCPPPEDTEFPPVETATLATLAASVYGKLDARTPKEAVEIIMRSQEKLMDEKPAQGRSPLALTGDP